MNYLVKESIFKKLHKMTAAKRNFKDVLSYLSLTFKKKDGEKILSTTPNLWKLFTRGFDSLIQLLSRLCETDYMHKSVHS